MKRSYTLRPLWKSIEVQSTAAGHLLVYPVWRQRRPGVLSRLAAASRLQTLVNAQLKGRK